MLMFKKQNNLINYSQQGKMIKNVFVLESLFLFFDAHQGKTKDPSEG